MIITLNNLGNSYPNMRLRPEEKFFTEEYPFTFEISYHFTSNKHIYVEIYHYNKNHPYFKKRLSNALKEVKGFFFDSINEAIKFLEVYLTKYYMKTLKIDNSIIKR